MPDPALPFAAALWLAPVLVSAAGALETLGSLLQQGLALIEDGYQRAPALMLVLSAIIILPLVALISFTVHATVRRKRRDAALRATLRRAQAGDWNRQAPAGGRGAAAWPSQAWLTVEGSSRGTMPLVGQVIRIGRHKDNDIRLNDSSVHRHHAVIERTPEEDFVITDIGGKEGNGVRINGARTEKAVLGDGDVIELGRAKLKFESAPV